MSLVWKCTSGVEQLPSVDLVLHYVSPVEETLGEVEVQGDGISQPGDQKTVVPPVEIYAPDLVADGEDYEGLKGI